MRSFDLNTQRLTRACSLALSLLVPLYCSSIATAQPTNDCLAPYWQDTLRCKAFPGQPPQPNFGTTPTNVVDVKDFTRVFLNNNPDVRCLDGTRPTLYVDKAVCTNSAGCNGTPLGEPIESGKWIFTMPGGGSCNAHDNDGDGVFDNAQECLDTYANPAEQGEMSSASDPPMQDLEGIHRPDTVQNPVFASYNRVRVGKCSYDRYNGRVTYEAVGGYFLNHTTPSGASVNVNLYQQGYLIMEEALQQHWRVVSPTRRGPIMALGGSSNSQRPCRRSLTLSRSSSSVILAGPMGSSTISTTSLSRLQTSLDSQVTCARFSMLTSSSRSRTKPHLQLMPPAIRLRAMPTAPSGQARRQGMECLSLTTVRRSTRLVTLSSNTIAGMQSLTLRVWTPMPQPATTGSAVIAITFSSTTSPRPSSSARTSRTRMRSIPTTVTDTQ